MRKRCCKCGWRTAVPPCSCCCFSVEAARRVRSRGSPAGHQRTSSYGIHKPKFQAMPTALLLRWSAVVLTEQLRSAGAGVQLITECKPPSVLTLAIRLALGTLHKQATCAASDAAEQNVVLLHHRPRQHCTVRCDTCAQTSATGASDEWPTVIAAAMSVAGSVRPLTSWQVLDLISLARSGTLAAFAISTELSRSS
jgi:hypothetical protein